MTAFRLLVERGNLRIKVKPEDQRKHKLAEIESESPSPTKSRKKVNPPPDFGSPPHPPRAKRRRTKSPEKVLKSSSPDVMRPLRIVESLSPQRTKMMLETTVTLEPMDDEDSSSNFVVLSFLVPNFLVLDVQYHAHFRWHAQFYRLALT